MTFYPEVLQIKEHAPTFLLFVVLFWNPPFGSLEEFGGASQAQCLFTQHDLPTHKQFLRNLILGGAIKYLSITCALTTFSPTPTSSKTISPITTLHIELNGFFPLFLEDYKLD
jgi:hypothetical protein